MRHEIIATKLVKRTRYEILFDTKLYWIAKINPKGIVSFLKPYRTVEAAQRGFGKI